MFNTILIKIPITFFTEIGKSILKYIWKHKRLQTSKAILSKKFNAGVSQYLTPNYTTEPSMPMAQKQTNGSE
jgi:hypothetical protein